MPTVLNLKYDGHRHQLALKKIKVPFFCDGCKELGFGLCYQCPNKKCDFVLHEECGIHRPPPFHKFFKKCNFKFHKKNPLGSGTRQCDACALDIQGCLYQCSEGKTDLHPCCAKLPLVFSPSDASVEIYLSKEIKTKCLKCHTRKSSSGRVQGLSYVSSDGNFCCHVACMKDVLFENWKKGYFQRDVLVDDRKKSIILKNFAPKEVALSGGKISPKVKRWVKYLAIFLKAVVSAILGEPFTLAFTLFYG